MGEAQRKHQMLEAEEDTKRHKYAIIYNCGSKITKYK